MLFTAKLLSILSTLPGRRRINIVEMLPWLLTVDLHGEPLQSPRSEKLASLSGSPAWRRLDLLQRTHNSFQELFGISLLGKLTRNTL